MDLNIGIAIQPVQRLNLTPEVRQSIEMLQFNMEEFLEYIEEQFLENPALEIDESSGSYEYEGDYRIWGNGEKVIDAIADTKPSIQEYLLFQLKMKVLTPHVRETAEYIILLLNENGYLEESCEKISKELKKEMNVTEKALEVVQSLDPPGIGARSISECLLLQIRERGIDNPLVNSVIKNDLELVATNRVFDIARKYRINDRKARNVIAMVKALDPYPAGDHAIYSRVEYVNPDAFIKMSDGEYVITLSEKLMPKLSVNVAYKDMLMDESQKEEVRTYLKAKVDKAKWLINTVNRRNRTIYQTIEIILQRQKEFFEIGESGLKPMVYRDVAEKLGIHETTVGRVVNGKYVQTPRGTFELRYFFPSGVGEGDSSVKIKHMINEIVNRENPKEPYTDSRITEILQEKGIVISRRTVAKYRDDLGILSSSKRRNRER